MKPSLINSILMLNALAMPSKFYIYIYIFFLLNSKCTKFTSRIKRIIVNSYDKIKWKMLFQNKVKGFMKVTCWGHEFNLAIYFSLKFFNAKLWVSLSWNWRFQVSNYLFNAISLPNCQPFILSCVMQKLFNLQNWNEIMKQMCENAFREAFFNITFMCKEWNWNETWARFVKLHD